MGLQGNLGNCNSKKISKELYKTIRNFKQPKLESSKEVKYNQMRSKDYYAQMAEKLIKERGALLGQP